MKNNGSTYQHYLDIILMEIKWPSLEIYLNQYLEMNNNGNNGMIEMIQKIHQSQILLNVLQLIKKSVPSYLYVQYVHLKKIELQLQQLISSMQLLVKNLLLLYHIQLILFGLKALKLIQYYSYCLLVLILPLLLTISREKREKYFVKKYLWEKVKKKQLEELLKMVSKQECGLYYKTVIWV